MVENYRVSMRMSIVQGRLGGGWTEPDRWCVLANIMNSARDVFIGGERARGGSLPPSNFPCTSPNTSASPLDTFYRKHFLLGLSLKNAKITSTSFHEEQVDRIKGDSMVVVM
jgi:hypothetical protein